MRLMRRGDTLSQLLLMFLKLVQNQMTLHLKPVLKIGVSTLVAFECLSFIWTVIIMGLHPVSGQLDVIRKPQVAAVTAVYSSVSMLHVSFEAHV